ncbi:MAG: Rrf2 family transcriptional regulator [Sedimenticola sp.]|uniref:Rrf2 family transcriptional regulator n=1 Tax=Sedimenticola thiotaurini TaxID=1543721 RepID=A0A558CMR7_9GAMM|nr:Rrf2 family transcriptional regulator [Sedimenticola sp.]MCW8947476.1 Rrf2 family transcriptional regulator [Sedimenticola sp.]MCW8949447.1 Rrf2 family transcriptional regulator [Sedimenticola sp.]MCW8974326.1 Rrf2 family transcriptional regulator [Sedimenticola sp.]TVT50066.1 MAG: Rrf2 family transcriptional regulator [Sedimenticola thiotaurini]
MRLTTFSDYTIRVLIYIGLRPGEMATIGELAEAYAISKNHLMKVVYHLGQQGYVETVRGKGGGFYIALDPQDINIGELIRSTEQGTVMTACFTEGSCACRIETACQMKDMLEESIAAFYQVLDRYTLADLLKSKTRLSKLLLK